MKPRSLSTRLLLWQLLWLLALAALSIPLLLWEASNLSYQIYDEQLLSSADSVIGRIEDDRNPIAVDLPSDARKLLAHQDKDNFYYQVVGSNNRLIDRDEPLPLPESRAQFDRPVFYQSTVNGTSIRILEKRVAHPHDPQNYVYVEVGETFNARKAFANRILGAFLMTEAVFITGSVIAIWLGVRRGLTPLKLLANSLALRGPNDLKPIAADDAPIEMAPVVETVNRLLKQIKDHIDKQTRFAANVAHQLRTPLTGVKTYMELAARSTENEKVRDLLVQADHGINRLMILIEKLLLLARSDPALLASQFNSTVDLNNVVLEAINDLRHLSEQNQIDLQFLPAPNAMEVFGDHVSLLELAKNIVENAMIHSPKGASVRVEIESSTNISLIVEDNGPGIPPNERLRIFEPFYRPQSTTAAGSGLGLSIARDIARAHQATIRIENPEGQQGTRLILTFETPLPIVS